MDGQHDDQQHDDEPVDEQEDGAYDGQDEELDEELDGEYVDQDEELVGGADAYVDEDDEPDQEQDQDWDAAGGEPRTGPLVVAGLVGVVTTLVLVLILIWTVLRPDDETAQRANGGSTSGQAGATSTSASLAGSDRGRQSRLGRCVRAEGALQRTLGAARPALDQWAVHVGAMNKLVVGEITLQQATEFWERTRVGAQRGVRDFDDSLAALRAEGVDCPAPGLLAPGARVLPACAREVQAAVRALQAAQVSVATWDEHIHHMDMLRLGQMTPEQATEMWLSSWQRGVRDLDAFEAASRTASALADREGGCSEAGSSR